MLEEQVARLIAMKYGQEIYIYIYTYTHAHIYICIANSKLKLYLVANTDIRKRSSSADSKDVQLQH